MGLGTTFKIYLPVIPSTPDQPRETQTSTALPRGSETILLVEDDERVRRLAARLLEGFGYQFLDASNAYDAIEIVERVRRDIHLLLTDVVMPQMNGRELARRVTQSRPFIKDLLASGSTESIIVHHGVLDEDLAFIAEPYTPHALARKVREVLDSET